MLTKTFIQTLIPNITLNKEKINNAGLCMIIAQCDYETAGFTKVEENLNYSAKRILEIFPKYFKNLNPENYANNPQKLANFIYANRMGNGDTASGDGFKYRGRGYIQLTGRDNYQRCGKYLNLDLIKHPELLCQPQNAIMSAIWFFKQAGIINNDDIVYVTKKINGGTNGIEKRTELFNAYKKMYNI